jgi:tetratricopeptide (TPR) repeat protein
VSGSDIEGEIRALAPLLQGDESAFEHGASVLQRIDAAHPSDAFVQYLIGSAYDSCGREALAILHYDRVFALGLTGLPEARRPELFVQAGSTLRNLGRFETARAVFQRGIAQYPDYRALRVFAAMNETSAGEDAAAARHLYAFVLMAEDGSIDRFRRSLTWYIGEVLKAGAPLTGRS